VLSASVWWPSVNGRRILSVRSHMSAPASTVPSAPPNLATSGWALRTRPELVGDPASSERAIVFGKRVFLATGGDRRGAASAASMPLFIAVWVPLIRGTLTNPAAQPISAPPGNASFGTLASRPR
jgi:hypothetical protein